MIPVGIAENPDRLTASKVVGHVFAINALTRGPLRWGRLFDGEIRPSAIMWKDNRTLETGSGYSPLGFCSKQVHSTACSRRQPRDDACYSLPHSESQVGNAACSLSIPSNVTCSPVRNERNRVSFLKCMIPVSPICVLFR